MRPASASAPRENVFRGRVLSIVSDPVISEIRIIADVGVLTALVSNRSLGALGVVEGDEVEVAFRSASVALARCLPGIPTYFHASPGQS